VILLRGEIQREPIAAADFVGRDELEKLAVPGRDERPHVPLGLVDAGDGKRRFQVITSPLLDLRQRADPSADVARVAPGNDAQPRRSRFVVGVEFQSDGFEGRRDFPVSGVGEEIGGGGASEGAEWSEQCDDEMGQAHQGKNVR
jgi:hypothetical protein